MSHAWGWTRYQATCSRPPRASLSLYFSYNKRRTQDQKTLRLLAAPNSRVLCSLFACVGVQFIFSGETESSPASFIAALGLAGTSRQQMRPCCHIPQLLQFQIVLQEFFLGTEQSPILDHIDNVLDKNFHILPKTALKT